MNATFGPLWSKSRGSAGIVVGVIDGPARIEHPALQGADITVVPQSGYGDCSRSRSMACCHGTAVLGILAAARTTVTAPGICPECRFVLRPIFDAVGNSSATAVPLASPETLAGAILDVVKAKVDIINLSLAITPWYSGRGTVLRDVLDYAGKEGAVIVAASGNQGLVGGSVVLEHPAVVPAVAVTQGGQVLPESNLGPSIGKRGVSACGEDIATLDVAGGVTRFTGTSAAAAMVTGALALLKSLLPGSSLRAIRAALVASGATRRKGIVPPIMNPTRAWLQLRGGQ